MVVLLVSAMLERRRRLRHAFLLAASYLFYAAWNEKLIVLILASTWLDFFVGSAIDRARDPWRRRLLLVSLVGNLGILGLFKYYDFFASSLGRLLSAAGLDLSPTLLHLTLPVGISFYTFQTLSYTLAIYRREIRPTSDWLHFSLFVAFFPQLVAGPIVRASQFLPQLEADDEKGADAAATGTGLFRLLRGLSKKALLADPLAVALVDPVFASPESADLTAVIIAGIAFRFQIYLDFSGYSDIAIGCGRLLGFTLPENFRAPYKAASIGEFWGRWHLTLGSWFRDYVYLPLGGSRRGELRAHANLWATMALVGLWHGARWTFLIWGLYYAVLLSLERLTRHRWRMPRTLGVVVTFALGCVAGVIFRSDSLGQLTALAAALQRSDTLSPASGWAFALLLVAAVSHFVPRTSSERIERSFARLAATAQAAVCLAVVIAIYLASAEARPFYYFQF